MTKVLPRRVKGGPTRQDRKKAWVREAALRLLEGGAGGISETNDERSKYAYDAIDQAEKIWDQAEGRFMTQKGKTNGH